MQIRGRRITIAGSAVPDVDATLLGYAHELIRHLVTSLFAEGALFSVGVGKEPRRMEDPSQSSVIFDWTVLETLGDGVAKAKSSASNVQGKLIATITTDKTTNQIPDSRTVLWSD